MLPRVFLSLVQKENHCSSSQALRGGEGCLSGQLSFWSGSVDGIVPLVRVFPLKERSQGVASMCQQSVSCRDAVSVRLTCDLGEVRRPRAEAAGRSAQVQPPGRLYALALPGPPLLQQAGWALGLLWPVAQAGMPTEPMSSLLFISSQLLP